MTPQSRSIADLGPFLETLPEASEASRFSASVWPPVPPGTRMQIAPGPDGQSKDEAKPKLTSGWLPDPMFVDTICLWSFLQNQHSDGKQKQRNRVRCSLTGLE